jgi:hypothetical protein
MVGRFKLKERENKLNDAEMLAMLRAELAREGRGGTKSAARALTLHREDGGKVSGAKAGPAPKSREGSGESADVIALDDDDFGKF